MRMRSRIKRIERKLESYRPLPAIIIVNEGFGETQETQYQKYIEEGGNPNAPITFIIMHHAFNDESTNPSDDPNWETELKAKKKPV